MAPSSIYRSVDGGSVRLLGLARCSMDGVLHCIYNYTDSCWFPAATVIRHSRHDISRTPVSQCQCTHRYERCNIVFIGAKDGWRLHWHIGFSAVDMDVGTRKESCPPADHHRALHLQQVEVRQHWRSRTIYWGVICKLNNVRFGVGSCGGSASISGEGAESLVFAAKCRVIDKINVCWREV